MFFIFSLIYISISTILGAGSYKTKDALKNVIIAAVLINFSLYFTKVIIDISNIFAVWLYTGIEGLTPGANGISDTIRSIFAIEKMFSTTKVNDLSAFAAIIAISALYIASIKVFLEVGFLFITRTVMFVFLLILSPIGFMGDVLPKLKTESGRWWKELTDQALVAPIFLLLLYITLLFINNIQNSSLLPTGVDKITNTSFTFGDYVVFIIMYFMIHKCLEIAKETSGKSGDVLGGIFKGAVGLGLGVVSGGAAWAGRRTLGSVATKFAANNTINDAASGKFGANRFTKFVAQAGGKAALGAARGTASSSFDARSTGIIENLGLQTKAFGVDASKAQKGGYQDMVKQREKSEKEYSKQFGDDAKGIERRTQYGQSVKDSLWGKISTGGFTASKIGRNLSEKEKMSVSDKAGASIQKEASAQAKKNKESDAKDDKNKNKAAIEKINSEIRDLKKKKEDLVAAENIVKGTSMEEKNKEGQIQTEKEITEKMKEIETLSSNVKLAEEVESREAIVRVAQETSASTQTNTETPKK
jgi:hypothetical protein